MFSQAGDLWLLAWPSISANYLRVAPISTTYISTTCQQGALLFEMALRNLKFEPGIYERRRRTAINVLNLIFELILRQ